MRVTETMRYNTTISNIFNIQSQYNDISEKLSSQKNINRASDDPVASTKIMEIRHDQDANLQYGKNMDSANSWLMATESNLQAAYDLLVKAHEIATGQATATANESTRRIMAQSVQSIIDEMGSIANAQLGDRYLFSGTRNDVAPFSTSSLNAIIETAEAAGNNTFQGNVASSGTYTGTINKTFAVKINDITTVGEFLGEARYRYSTDGGKTWSAESTIPANGAVDLGEGVTLTFDDQGGTKGFGENDIFYVNAVASGFYCGNEATLSMPLSRSSDIEYNITGAEAFTASGSYGVDVFQALTDLRDALNSNNVQGISVQLTNLKNAQNQITLNQSLCGTKENYIEVARNSKNELDIQLESLLSQTQDADLADLATKLSMKEIALQASYAVASKIANTSILDFLK